MVSFVNLPNGQRWESGNWLFHKLMERLNQESPELENLSKMLAFGLNSNMKYCDLGKMSRGEAVAIRNCVREIQQALPRHVDDWGTDIEKAERITYVDEMWQQLDNMLTMLDVAFPPQE